jgi:Tfp pilus assembly protein FimT
MVFNRVAGDSKVTGGIYSYLQITKVKAVRRHLAHSVLRDWSQIACYASRDWDHGWWQIHSYPKMYGAN